MQRTTKRNVAIGATALALVGAAGGAYAATSSSPGGDRQALLNDAAKRLDVTPEKLRSALDGAFADRLAQAVKDGRLTQTQADAIKRHANGAGPLGGPPRGGMMFHAGGPGDFLGAAADYLGLTAAQLRTQLDGETSLADVAKAQGKSVDGLEAAIVADAKKRLDTAVASGELPASQRDQMLKDLQTHVSDLVQGKGGPCPGGAPGGPGGPPPGFRMRHEGSVR